MENRGSVETGEMKGRSMWLELSEAQEMTRDTAGEVGRGQILKAFMEDFETCHKS